MEEEAERRRQPPLKLEPEPEVKREKSYRDREREKRVSVRPVEPAPEVPPKHSDDEEAAAADDVEEEDGEEEGGYPPEAEVSPEVKPSQLKPAMRPITTAPSVSSASGNGTPGTPGSPSNDSPCGIIIPGENTPELQPLEEHRPKIGLSLKLGECCQKQQILCSLLSQYLNFHHSIYVLLYTELKYFNNTNLTTWLRFFPLQAPPAVPVSSAPTRGRS